MARKSLSDMSAWPSLTLEGNLIAAPMIQEIDHLKAPDQGREDYSIRKGLDIREEISLSFRVAQSHFDEFQKIESPSAERTRRFAADLFKEAFGFDDLESTEAPLAMMAGGRVPFVLAPPSEELDRRSPTLSTDVSRSPESCLQTHLNDDDGSLWGIVTNGLRLRLMRKNLSLTRPTHIEADLEQMLKNEDIASFTALWLLIHRTRFGAAGAPMTDCPLERWREKGSRDGVAARDKLSGQVEKALLALGSGFLASNLELAVKLRSGEADIIDWFNELLRLVYRLIFLMVAEDRNLLHPKESNPRARALYAKGYSLDTLRRQSTDRNNWDNHRDRYEVTKIVFAALAHGEDGLALPALGGLFAEDGLPHCGTANLGNRAFMEAIYHLSWLRDKSSIVPINWRAMETEELGSVYESLLGLQPRLSDDGKELDFSAVSTEKRGNQRKSTGSYYTPDSLVQSLLDTTLTPVINRVEAEADDPAEALLKLSVIDPACGSGHFLLAAARRIARRVAHLRAGGTPSAEEFRQSLRDTVRNCIHGVDLNPMAVELTKVALWIETVDPGLVLGFFDSQILCGDALLGVFDLKALDNGIPDSAYKKLTGDNKKTTKFYRDANKNVKRGQGTLDFKGGQSDLPAVPHSSKFSKLRELPENTLEDIAYKSKIYRDLRTEHNFLRIRMSCDLYIAAFLLPKTENPEYFIPLSDSIWLAISAEIPSEEAVAAITHISRARPFHWPLEFPDIMIRGGFDVVIGNPPWERIKLQEQEFFATRDHEISMAPNKAARSKLINALRDSPLGSSKRRLLNEFEAAKRFAEATSTFARLSAADDGRFPLTGTGDINTYALFSELFLHLMAPRGQGGIIIPTGIATDATTARFFAHLVSEKRLSSVMDFENSAPIFPTVHRSFNFCLLTMVQYEPEAHFAFFLTQTSQLGESERVFTLTPEQIAILNPNTKTAPVFRSRTDAELTAKIYANVPVLIEEDEIGEKGNPWGVTFMRMFDMSGDSHLFRTALQLSEAGYIRTGVYWSRNDIDFAAHPLVRTSDLIMPLRTIEDNCLEQEHYIPLYEAKMAGYFDHRAAGYDRRGDSRGYRVLPPTCIDSHRDPFYEVSPYYWVNNEIVQDKLRNVNWNYNFLLGWRDITSAISERTLIPTILPYSGCSDTILLMFPNNSNINKILGIYGNMSSLPFDYVARQKISGVHLKYNTVKQLPILPPEFYNDERISFINSRVLELTYTSHSLSSFAQNFGYDAQPYIWNDKHRSCLRADIDAFYARAYGLTFDQLRYILDPAEVNTSDYPSQTFRVLKKREIHEYGEYRTQRLVIESWNRMEENGEFANMGM